MYPTLPTRRNNLGSVDVVRPPQPNPLGEGMSNKMTERERKEYEEQIAEFFRKGGVVTKCATGETSDISETSVWKKSAGRPKKKK